MVVKLDGAALYVVEAALHSVAGHETAVKLRKQAAELRDHLTGYDLGTGNPFDRAGV